MTAAAASLNASVSTPPDGYHAPSISEFFYDPILLDGTPFAINRIVVLMLLMTAIVGVFFVTAFRRPQVVPRGIQNVGEVALDFVRIQIVEEIMGKKDGARFLPIITAIFFTVLAFNVTAVLPMIHLPVNGLVAVPLFLALVVYVTFNYAGIKKHGLGHYLTANLFPPGVPKALYLLVTPIEFVSTFILRPVTLTVRLLANMMAGHLMLALFFSATTYLLFGFEDGRWWTALFGVGSFVMAMLFTMFELLVIVLQAYIFALLASVYISGALSETH